MISRRKIRAYMVPGFTHHYVGWKRIDRYQIFAGISSGTGEMVEIDLFTNTISMSPKNNVL